MVDTDFLRIFAKEAFRSSPKQLRNTQSISTMNNTKVDILISTADDQFSAQTGFNLIKILNDLGIETNYPMQQTSCGKEHYEAGDYDNAKLLGERLFKQFSGSNHVVCSSSAWVAYIRKAFPKLFFNSAYHIEYPVFCKKIHDITDFLVNFLNITCVNNAFPHKVVFLDNCHTLNDYGLHDEPRVLLRNTEGLELVELPDDVQHTCCGWGNMGFASDFEAISTELARRKVEAILATGADTVTSTDTACLLHLQSYTAKNKIPLNFVPIIDILASKKD